MRKFLSTAIILAAVSGASPAAAAEPVKTISPAELKTTLDAEKGKMVVLNLWATWCAPCLVEIPDLIRLEKDLKDLNVKLVGLSVDEPRATTAAISAMRDQRFPTFNTYARGKDDVDTLISVVDPTWNEVVPTTYILGRDGAVKARIQGKKSIDDFKAAVKAAAAAP